MTILKILAACSMSLLIAGCGGGEGSPGLDPNQVKPVQVPYVTNLFGSTIEVVPGESKTYTLKGGTPPYTNLNADVKIAVLTVGADSFTVTGVSKGTVLVGVRDYHGFDIVFTVIVK